MLLFAKAWRIAAALLLATPALAEEPLLLAGVGVGVERSPYRGVDERVRLLPMLVYENRWISVAGPSLDFKLPDAGPVQLRLRARYGFDGYEADDSPALLGMAERKGSLWLGAAAVWEGELGQLGFELMGDASSHSKARLWKLEWEKRFQLGERLDLTPRVVVRGLDRRFVDYYYGVRVDEARVGRSAYTGVALRQPELGLRLGYRLQPDQLLFADVSARKLGTAIERSPLVERRYEAGLFAGWMMRF